METSTIICIVVVSLVLAVGRIVEWYRERPKLWREAFEAEMASREMWVKRGAESLRRRDKWLHRPKAPGGSGVFEPQTPPPPLPHETLVQYVRRTGLKPSAPPIQRVWS
jgi:hypothetical protein